MPVQLYHILQKPADSAPKPWPLLIFLHGRGERAPAGQKLELLRRHGPWSSPGIEQFLLLAPQCPDDRVWMGLTDEVVDLVKRTIARNHVDVNRVYITGFSMGAFGAWAVVASQPSMFAAIVPIAGGFAQRVPRSTASLPIQKLIQTAVPLDTVRALCSIPAWILHGMNDDVVRKEGSQNIYGALRKASPSCSAKLTLIPGASHTSACKIAYGMKSLLTWVSKQRCKPKTSVAAYSLVHGKVEFSRKRPAASVPSKTSVKRWNRYLARHPPSYDSGSPVSEAKTMMDKIKARSKWLKAKGICVQAGKNQRVVLALAKAAEDELRTYQRKTKCSKSSRSYKLKLAKVLWQKTQCKM